MDNDYLRHTTDYPEEMHFSMDTAHPQLYRMDLDGEFPQMVESNSLVETSAALGQKESPFGGIEYERVFDKDGNLVDWSICLYPMVDQDSLAYMKEVADTQPTLEDRERILSIYNQGMPSTEISPNGGIVMSYPNSELHIENDKKYVVWNNGITYDFGGHKTPDPEIHYVTGDGLTVKAKNIPGPRGTTVSELYFDANLKYLSIGAGEILSKIDGLMRNNNVEESTIRSLVDVRVSISQQTSGGELVKV